MGFFDKLKEGLLKTKKNITERVDQVLVAFGKIDDELFDELEEVLITSDMGVDTSLKVIEELKKKVRDKKLTNPADVKQLLKDELYAILHENEAELNLATTPSIILVIGVNGVGKTTFVGKVAHLLRQQGKRVMLAAGDTFRAAAIDQLEVWGNRAGVEVVKQAEGSDPAAVVFDAIQAAKSRKVDVLICDTAGRLHTKKNLMDELKKVYRVIERELPNASREVLLVLDATSGQNAITQAKVFSEAAEVTGIVLTKLDGTAKGGVIISVKNELKVPVKLIGVGEKIDDLQPFNARDFIEALFA